MIYNYFYKNIKYIVIIFNSINILLYLVTINNRKCFNKK